MSWDKTSELVVASYGEISVAPVGTALPTTPTAALNAAFVGLGFATEDGVTLTVTPEITEFKAWQSRQAVRRELTAQEIQVSFNLEQWNESTIPFAFGGGVITNPSGGVYRYDFPTDDAALDERALVVDARDGTRRQRYVFPRGNVTEAVAAQFARSQLSELPIAFKALEPTDQSGAGYVLFDDAAAFATGS